MPKSGIAIEWAATIAAGSSSPCEIVPHQAPRGRDHSRPAMTGEPIVEADKLDGSSLGDNRKSKSQPRPAIATRQAATPTIALPDASPE